MTLRDRAPGPVVETERLILRLPQAEDAAPVCAFFTSPRAIHVGGPYDGRAAWLRFAAFAGHWQLAGFGWFAITARAGGALLGMCGPHHPAYKPERELGWFVFEAAEGQGIAFEAAQAARLWTRRALPAASLVSYIAPGNPRSEALARRLGARPDGPAAHSPGQTVWRHPENAR